MIAAVERRTMPPPPTCGSKALQRWTMTALPVVFFTVLAVLDRTYAPSARSWSLLPQEGSHVSHTGANVNTGRALNQAQAELPLTGSAVGEGQRAKAPPGTLCVDTCRQAKNGMCEDGRSANTSLGPVGVYCDLGTDCTDCGPWTGSAPTFGQEQGFTGPIAWLLARNVKVLARRTVNRPPFVMLVTDAQTDLDVSEQILRSGVLEIGITQIFEQVLRDRCTSPDVAARPLVVDVGANMGYFSLVAAGMGCRVLAFEPVPRFRAFMEWSIAANGLGHLISLRAEVLGEKHGLRTEMVVPKQGVWGTAAVSDVAGGMMLDMERVPAITARLDQAVQEDVLLLKVDVEGYEPVVFRSAEGLLKGRKVDNIVMEYSPGVAERLHVEYSNALQVAQMQSKMDAAQRAALPALLVGAAGKVPPPPVALTDNPLLLADLLRKGYRMVYMPDNYAKGGDFAGLDLAPPALTEVTAATLVHDMADMAEYANGTLRCPIPPELQKVNPLAWRDHGCNVLPEDCHPNSLRIMFTFNTNLWATKNASLLRIEGPVGLFNATQDPDTTWWPQHQSQLGVGYRGCPYLPPHHQLRNRCKCLTPAQCGEEQRVLLELLAQGRMPGRRTRPGTAAGTGAAATT